MDLLPPELLGGAAAARERFQRVAVSAAQANTSASGPTPQSAMASAARDAIFADALLSAMRARLEELKGLTK